MQNEQDVGNEETDFRRKKIVVLAEYFDQQTNFSRYRRKMSQSRRSPLSGNQSYLPFLIKQMESMSQRHNSRPHNLRMALKKYFRFQ